MDFETRLKQANACLKRDRIRSRIYRTGSKLYLRATLPPKPGSGKLIAHQQWISLNISATPEGLKAAVNQAKLVSSQLDCRLFRWEETKHDNPIVQTKQWIDKFRDRYFLTHPQNPKSETTWKIDYQAVYAKLPGNQPLTEKILEDAILSSAPNTRTRRRYVIAICALARFAGLSDQQLKTLMGNYSPRRAAPRDLPEDFHIAEIWAKIVSPEWRWAFGVIAAYGLRPHEVFLVNCESFPVLYVLEGKTSFRHCRPVYPEWAEQWELGNHLPPKCTAKNNRDLGSRVSHAFKRLEIPFRPYDLRHRWAIRSLEFGYDLSLAAAEMGHSVAVHSQLYHHWISESIHDKAFERLMSNPQRLKPPGHLF